MIRAVSLFLLAAGLSACEEYTINMNQIPGPGPLASELLVDRLEVVPPFVEAVNGTRFELKAHAYAGNVPIDTGGVSWSSDDPSVANILSTAGGAAIIKAEGPGTAGVTARLGRAEGRAQIRIRAAN